MSEYRALRQKYSLLELCRTPELAAEVTLQPVRRLEVDAAILFSDLLLPLEPMGIPFDFVKGEGPQIDRPIRSAGDIARLRVIDPAVELSYVLDAIGLIRRELAGQVPLIGFAGAPFTLASYAIEGGHSSHFALTKALMYGEPEPGTTCARSSPPLSPATSGRRSRPASRRCRSSTPGSAS
jgi:uroporphyrinogen decarboxylase